MAVFSLASITETLIWMLETRIPALPDWPSIVVQVSPLPPDRLQASSNLGLYLYHLAEAPHYKNLPAGQPSECPIALNLYYQLTAQVGEANVDAYRAQDLMGAAVRVMHDFPCITDGTILVDAAGNVQNILAQRGLEGRGNRITITLRPMPVEESVSYWTAGDAPLRLAAYYLVSVIVLDSEPATRAAPAVLRYGSGVFATGAPQLTGSRAILPIVVGRDAAASSVLVQPAQVTVGQGFTLEGSGLAGQSTTLRLRDARGTRLVDSSLWAVVASSERVVATVSEVLGDSELIPGSLDASVVVTRAAQMGGGGQGRGIAHSSNETPIVVTPRLDPVSPTAGPTLGSAAPGSELTWTGWRFLHGDIPTAEGHPHAVHVYVGDRLLRLRTRAGALLPGELRVTSATALSVRLPDDLGRGALLPVRVGVRGAFSAPLWLAIT